MTKYRFKTIKVRETKIVKQDGIELTAYISGVNSGVYGMPFVIEVNTWISTWFGQKKYRRVLKLNLTQCKELRDELIEACNVAERT